MAELTRPPTASGLLGDLQGAVDSLQGIFPSNPTGAQSGELVVNLFNALLSPLGVPPMPTPPPLPPIPPIPGLPKLPPLPGGVGTIVKGIKGPW